MRMTMVLPLVVLVGFPLSGRAQEVVSLPGEDRALELERQELYSVGVLDGEEWEMFSRIQSVAFDGSGNLHIFDSDVPRLVVVGPDGRFQREVVRVGDGPGEVTRPLTMGVSPEGVVTVVDMGRWVLARFGTGGDLLGTRRFSPEEDGVPGPPLHPHPDGGFVILQSGIAIRRGPGDGPPAPPTSYPLRWIPGGDEPWRTLYEAWRPRPEGSPRGGPQVSTTPGGAQIRFAPGMRPRVFDPVPSFGVRPDGRLMVADTVTWNVKVVGPDGSVEKVLTRPFRPRAVTERDRRAERQRRAREIEAGEGPQVQMSVQGPSGPMNLDQGAIREALLAQLDELEFAPEMPVLERIAVDREGRVWVARRGEVVGERGPVDVVSAQGTYLGTLPVSGMRLPDAFGPGGLAAFVEADELGVPRVRVERIRLNPR